jgi:2-polyprenyl-3-methyl-5-hydroxy-6-metoxy-1,4-benzoquinol methylase
MFSIESITWKYISVREAGAVVLAVLPVTVALLLGRIFLATQWSLLRIPLSVIALESSSVLIGTLGVRMADRLAHELSGRESNKMRRILLIGAGNRGERFLSELRRSIRPEIEVLGFVDDDPRNLNTVIHGVRVLGDTSMIPEIVKRYRIEEAVITIANLPSEDERRIMEAFKGTGIRLVHFYKLFDPFYDDVCLPDGPLLDPETLAREQMRVFRELTGRDYDATAEVRYPVNHVYEVNKPFSDPKGLSGDLLMAAGAMIKLLHLAPGAEVLDLGCGCGWTSILLARCGFQVTGVDLNPASLEIARRNAAIIGVPVNFIQADIQSFAAKRLFDAVVIFDSLHHCLRERSVLSRSADALRPGGKIFLCEQDYPDEDRAGILSHEAAVHAMREHGTLEKGLGTRYLIRLLFDCGFERATLFTTQSHYRPWLMARKPRAGTEAKHSVYYATSFERAFWSDE